MDIELKLKNFSQVVLKEAKLYYDNILYKVDEEFVAICEKYKDNEEKITKQQLEQEEQAIKLEVTKNITNIKMEAQKEILHRKDLLIQKVMEEALAQLQHYMEQENYVLDIIDAIENAKKVLKDDGSHMKAVILEKDSFLAEKIFSATNVQVIKVHEDGNFIGGVKVGCDNTNMQIDASIGSKLKKARQSLQKKAFIH